MRVGSFVLAMMLGTANLAQAAAATPVAAHVTAAAVLDTRDRGDAGEAARARQALARAKGVRLPLDPALDVQLSCAPAPDPLAVAAAEASARAGAAYAELRCADVDALVTTAAGRWLHLPDGAATRAEITKLVTYDLLCADQTGDRPVAARAAARLRALGGDQRPDGVPAAVWSRVPAIDATANVPLALLVVDAATDARVEVDLAPVGRGRVQVSVAPGEHWVAVIAANGARAVQIVDIDDKAARSGQAPVTVTPGFVVSHGHLAFEDVGVAMSALCQHGELTGKSVAKVMRAAGVTLAIVLVDTGGVTHAELWRVGASGDAEQVATQGIAVDDEAALTRVAAASGSGPATPLGDGKGDDKDKGDEDVFTRHWPWFAVGALVIGAGIVLAASAGSTVQRVEVRWP